MAFEPESYYHPDARTELMVEVSAKICPMDRDGRQTDVTVLMRSKEEYDYPKAKVDVLKGCLAKDSHTPSYQASKDPDPGQGRGVWDANLIAYEAQVRNEGVEPFLRT